MNKLALIVLAALLMFSSLTHAEDAKPAATADAAPAPRLDKDGWQILFDGKDLDCWNTDAVKGVWAINDNGELYMVKGGGYLYTKARYCDFIFECDFKVQPDIKANSGVFLHVHNMGNPVNTGMEIQVLNNPAHNVKWDAMNACGALYDLVHPTQDANNPPGEWNHYRLSINDDLVIVEMNGKQIVEAHLSKWTDAHKNPDGSHNKFPYAIGSLPREGFIGLQNHGGPGVWYRNIRLKTLTDRKPQYTGKEPITAVLKK